MSSPFHSRWAVSGPSCMGRVMRCARTFPRHTIGGGIAIWRMWLREARHLMLSGQVPYPSVISLKLAGDFERAFGRFRREAMRDAPDV